MKNALASLLYAQMTEKQLERQHLQEQVADKGNVTKEEKFGSLTLPLLLKIRQELCTQIEISHL